MLTETIFSSGSKVKDLWVPPAPPLHGPQEPPYLNGHKKAFNCSHPIVEQPLPHIVLAWPIARELDETYVGSDLGV